MCRRALSLLIGVALLLVAVARVAGADTPNPSLTPGVASGAVTQQNLATTICVSGFASSVRNVSTVTKHRVYAEYHIAKAEQRRYVIDHLIPLEVGGTNDIANLWPEPKGESKTKDKLEDLLHDDVCRGDLTLADAQRIAVGPVDAGLTTAKHADGSARRPQAPGPARATAQCADGTYSFSRHRQGTCSAHGGVRQWL
jgi:uncharacterized protein DUF3761